MKMKEAPEKIYLFENPITETPDDRWLSKRSDENDIEYTHTDSFVEKACEWLRSNVNNYIINDKYILPNGNLSRDWFKIKSDMFDDFKKYLKGE